MELLTMLFVNIQGHEERLATEFRDHREKNLPAYAGGDAASGEFESLSVLHR